MASVVSDKWAIVRWRLHTAMVACSLAKPPLSWVHRLDGQDLKVQRLGIYLLTCKSTARCLSEMSERKTALAILLVAV